jgi:hypothetical protein
MARKVALLVTTDDGSDTPFGPSPQTVTLTERKIMAPKTEAPAPAKGPMKPKQKYVIVRTYSAGVFAGTLVSRDGKEVQLANARRLWYWAGAASLSQLAVSGTSKPSDCKFPVAVPSVTLTEAIEILDVTPEAETSIKDVPVWKN